MVMKMAHMIEALAYGYQYMYNKRSRVLVIWADEADKKTLEELFNEHIQEIKSLRGDKYTVKLLVPENEQLVM